MNEKQKIKQKYIVRCNHAGVFFGEIIKREGQEVRMANVRKLWYWSGAAGVEELAKKGVSYPKQCKFTVTVDEITLTDAIQIIPCTVKSINSLEAVHDWKIG